MENKKEIYKPSQITFETLADEYVKIGMDYAIATANWEMLDESKKSVLAKIATSKEGTEAARERQARVDDEFKDYLVGVQAARSTMLNLRVKLDSLEMQFKYYQSVNANKRNEQKIL